MKRVTAQKPEKRHPSAANDTMLTDRDGGVFRAGGLKAARAGDSGHGVKNR